MNAPLARLSALAAVLTALLVSCPTDPLPKQNRPPIAAFTSSLTVQAMTALAFDASSSSDPDGDALIYTWVFGDGTRGGSSSVAHVFTAAGSFEVRLTVTDPSGAESSLARTVTVLSRTVTAGAAVSVVGTVLDVSGAALAGAKVELVGDTLIASSDATGKVVLSLPTNVAHALRITKAGYADQYRVLALPSSATGGFFEARLTLRGASQTLDASAGGSVSSSDGAKLTLPAGSLIDATGKMVSGAIQVSLTPIDVTDSAKVTGFPGAFAGITASGSSSPIVSFGTTEFALSQGDVRLQVALGKSATIELPIYAALNLDGSPVKVGDVQPLWSLDERSGLWVQEGSGVVVASTASPSGLALRGVVTHFSWWNTDIGFDPARPKPRCGPDPTIPGAGSYLANETICNMIAEMDRGLGTGSSGNQMRAQAVAPRLPGYRASITIPINGSVPLPIPAGNNVILRGCALGGTWCGQVTVNQAAGSSDEVFIALRPLSDALTVAITSPVDTVYANFSQTFQVALGGGLLPDSVEFFNGNASIGTANNSSFTWYTGNLPEGSYSVTARATLGTRTATSAPVTVIVDRTLPTVISRTPVPGALGGAGGAIQAVFSEPILASSLTDASVVLKVAGVTVARSLALSGDGRTLTITPSAALPVPADVGVTFGFSATAVSDLAKNALVNPATAWTWKTSLWSPVGGPVEGTLKVVQPYPSMTLGADGQPLESFVGQPSATSALTDLYVRRFDGANWQTVGAALSGFNGAGVQSSVYCSSVVTDASSNPVVIWQELMDASLTNYAYYARRFNPTIGNWEAIGPDGGKLPSFAYSACEYAPSVGIDSSGRIVIAYATGGGLLVKRFDGTNWLGLGANDGNLGIVNFGGFSMALNASGNPVIIFNELGSPSVVKRYNSVSDAWEPIRPDNGKLRAAGLVVNKPKLILDAAGNPLVSGVVGVPYGSSTTTQDVTVFRYTGTDWQELGPRAAGYGVAVGFEAAVALDANGNPVLAYLGAAVNGNNLYVKRFANSSWQGVASDFGAVGILGNGWLSLRLGSAGKLLLGFDGSFGSTSTLTVIRSP